MKNKYSKSEKDTIRLTGRRLAMSLLSMLFVIYAFIVFSIAWFSMGKYISTTGANVKVDAGGSLGFTLYAWNGTSETEGTWNAVTLINLTDCVPNETRRYLVVADGNSISSMKFTFSDETVVGENADNESTFDYSYISLVSQGNSRVTVDPETQAVTYDYGADSSDYFRYANITEGADIGHGLNGNSEYSLSVSGNSAVFDIYISKDVCNYFISWGYTATLEIG